MYLPTRNFTVDIRVHFHDIESISFPLAWTYSHDEYDIILIIFNLNNRGHYRKRGSFCYIKEFKIEK